MGMNVFIEWSVFRAFAQQYATNTTHRELCIVCIPASNNFYFPLKTFMRNIMCCCLLANNLRTVAIS